MPVEWRAVISPTPSPPTRSSSFRSARGPPTCTPKPPSGRLLAFSGRSSDRAADTDERQRSTLSEPAIVEVFDTTLRDGLQVEGVSATVEDKLRIAEQLDLPRRALHRGRLAGRQPEGHRVLRPRRDRAAAGDEHARRLRLDPPPAGQGRRRPHAAQPASRPARRRCASSPRARDYHVTEALQTTLDEGEAMIADSVEFLAGHGRRVLVDMEHFFDGYKAQPRVLAAGARGGGRQGRHATSCCATPTAARCPHEVERDRRRRARPRRRRRRSIGIHCHDDTGCAVANSMAAVRAGAGHVQGTLNGLGERTGNANLTTIIPNLQLKLGYTCLPEGRIERLTAVSHHVAETAQPGRQPAGAVRRLVGVRPQGRAARQRHRPGQGRLRARRPRARRQRHPLRRQRDGRAGRRSR